MTNKEVKERLKAKLQCYENTTHNQCAYDCVNCGLEYAQGNMGAQKDALRVAIKQIEKLEQIEQIINSEIERGDCVLHCNLTKQIEQVLESEVK